MATVWRLNQVAKIACLAETGAVFKSFSVFPRTFVTVHLLSKLSPSQTLRVLISNLHCCILSAQNLQVTGMGFQFRTHFYLILCFSLWFFAYVCDLEMGLCFVFFFWLLVHASLTNAAARIWFGLSCFLIALHPVLSLVILWFYLNFELLSCFKLFLLRLWVLLC